MVQLSPGKTLKDIINLHIMAHSILSTQLTSKLRGETESENKSDRSGHEADSKIRSSVQDDLYSKKVTYSPMMSNFSYRFFHEIPLGRRKGMSLSDIRSNSHATAAIGRLIQTEILVR